MKLIYPIQSVASALRSLTSGLCVRGRDACDRQYIWRPLDTGTGPCDIVIRHHFRVHPVRPLDKGVPSFPATCEFDRSPRLDREKATRPSSFTYSCRGRSIIHPRVTSDYLKICIAFCKRVAQLTSILLIKIECIFLGIVREFHSGPKDEIF